MEDLNNLLRKKIVIIGGGIAGIACARYLILCGFKNVLVLEATDRIGGRIYTVNHRKGLNEYFMEFGAEWIHGKMGNIAYRNAEFEDLIDKSAPDYYQALWNGSKPLSEEEFKVYSSLVRYLFKKFIKAYEDLDTGDCVTASTFKSSAAELLDKIFAEYLKELNDPSLEEILKTYYDWFIKIQCEMIGCESLSLVSAILLNQYHNCEGPKNIQLKSGFASLLKVLIKKIPMSVFQLEHVVSKIDWTDFQSQEGDSICETSAGSCTEKVDLKVKVFCKNGAVFEADHVVITIPLGCLKKQVDTLFIPKLSEDKLTAIQLVGFGTVNKVFLEFEDPFWESPTIFKVIWKNSFDEILESSGESSKIWLKDINRFAYTPGHPHMLCAWVVGEGAIIMENLSINEVLSNCMELLEKVLGKKLPPPKRILRSKWHSDLGTQGSYSYLTTDSNKDSISHIAEPVFVRYGCYDQHPVLLFAGEATHASYFSTVHGAFESGVKEAIRITSHYGYTF